MVFLSIFVDDQLKRVESKNDGKPKNHLQTKNDAQTKNDGEAKVNWKEVDIWNCGEHGRTLFYHTFPFALNELSGRVLQFIMGFPEKIKTCRWSFFGSFP